MRYPVPKPRPKLRPHADADADADADAHAHAHAHAHTSSSPRLTQVPWAVGPWGVPGLPSVPVLAMLKVLRLSRARNVGSSLPMTSMGGVLVRFSRMFVGFFLLVHTGLRAPSTRWPPSPARRRTLTSRASPRWRRGSGT